jgi:hypothetical protein
LFLQKRIIGLIVAVLVILLIGAFNSAYPTVRVNQEEMVIDGDVIFAYLKTYNVSDAVGGLGSKTLVSYVLVLNITNPNSETIHLTNVLVTLFESAVKEGASVSGTTEIIRYERSIGDNERPSYTGSPNSSKLMAFTATGELDNLDIQALNGGEVFLLVYLNGRTQADVHISSELNLKKLSLDIVSETEYQYNTAFLKAHMFSFRNDDPNIKYAW